jgi:hypothetical protein
MAVNAIFSWIIKKRIHQIDLFKKYPLEVQDEWFWRLIESGSDTDWGRQHCFKDIESYEDFKKRVPLQDYNTLKPYIDLMISGQQQVLWNSEVKWFAKSSGTTSDKSKFIPISIESLEDCHYKGGKDLISVYYNLYPNANLYGGKHLVVGGSSSSNSFGEDSYFGDLSAIIVKNLPFWVEQRRTPSREIALMENWEEKVLEIASSTIHEDVSLVTGVPSWTLVIFNKVLEITGKKHIHEVWPNLECFMHGGVKFEPYRDAFEKILPHRMNYIESYNASEGYFGIQDQLHSNDLLLMLDYGIFFEFIPMSSFDGLNSKEVCSLADVEIGVNYAVVITTNGGLWRYIIGDTIQFTEKFPFRFLITGRTAQFINAFGEELVVANTDQAIAKASLLTNAQIRDYSAAPVYMNGDSSGGAHEWLVEFEIEPESMERFAFHLDAELKKLNSDYEAKRVADIALGKPIVRKLPYGTFEYWLKSKGKLGGQHKVPRLSNERKIIEEIWSLCVSEFS